MRIKEKTISAAIALFLILATAAAMPAQISANEAFGVFQYVVTGASGTPGEISKSISEAATGAGWEVLAEVDPGTPDDCEYTAKVLVLFHPEYAGSIVEANEMTGPYAALDRINIFQDENGTHVSVVNPNSINRTVLMDDEKFKTISQEHLQVLRSMILSAVKGDESDLQYGQMRDEGLIGKTMGVVAGGRFEDLIEEKAGEKGDLENITAAVARGMSEKGRKWGMELVYQVRIPGRDVYILGTTGSPMDMKSFEIVGAGTDESRKGFKFPGLSHAAAYPLEIVVSMEDGEIKVRMINAMFRMKMYFEDAGKISFMKNMKMPGSIDKELKKQIRNGLKS